MLVGVFNRIYLLPKPSAKGVWFGAGKFVFLVLSMLYPNDTLTGFAKATKTCPAAKRH